eukprot:CAMPEP_0116851034 /NCGR_PEP_ID=MMETSP0418-20121206/16490_1 /TAXON_ID=1158023 /ORGANISM="Astrosyne radiata, Strain 13vi08-1A" /LENGTH=274 /DNA_ID=CAMNT_0004482995 /DNA_START=53 /DNA_END=877 /DNA_ORIENTATION=+
MEEVISTLKVMRMQEEGAYRCGDYLATLSPPTHSDVVDKDCRIAMARWCFKVVDFLNFSRETVHVAMSYLDRFLMTAAGRPFLLHRANFQLAVMTCMYTAVKIHEPEALSPSTIAKLSQGAYSEQQVVAMETVILKSIGWRMNPPTATSFLHSFLTLLPTQEKSFVQLAQYQTELAVLEYEFVGVNPSTIAFAALANAFEQTQSLDANDALHLMSNIAGIPRDSEVVSYIQAHLWTKIHQCDELAERTISCANGVSQKLGVSQSALQHSPRTVL